MAVAEARSAVAHRPSPLSLSLLYLAAHLALSWLASRAESSYGLAAVHPTAGLGLALLLVGGLRMAPLLVAGQVLSGLALAGDGLAALLVQGSATATVHAVVAAALLRAGRFDPALRSPRDVLALVAVALLGSVPVVPLVLALSAWRGAVPWAEYPLGGVDWWTGQALAVLVVTPLLLSWTVRQAIGVPRRAFGRRRNAAEAVLALGTGTAIVCATFGTRLGAAMEVHHLVALPLMAWTLRHGLRGAVAANSLLTLGLIVVPRLLPHAPEPLAALPLHTLGLVAAVLILGAVVSAQKRAAEDLALSEDRYRRLVENVADVIFTLSPDGTVLSVAPRYTQWTGFGCDQAVGQSVDTLLHPDDLPTALHALARVRLGDHGHPIPLRVLTSRGDCLPVEVVCQPVGEPGSIREIIGVARDIRERLAAEEAVRRRERYFRALIQNSSDVIGVVDAEGRLQYLSPSAEGTMGLRPDEWIGRRATALVHPEDVGRVEERIRTALVGGASGEPIEYRYRHGSGEWRLAESVGSNLLGDPDVHGLVVHTRDITERRSLEARLADAERLESIGRLAGGMAHDFNNLLTTILGYTDLLRQRHADDDATRADLDAIHQAGARAAALTQQVLAFARRQVCQPRPMGIGELIDALEPGLRTRLGAVRLTRLPSEAPGTVEVDPEQMEQVLAELAVNAVRAMDGDGELTVSTCAWQAPDGSDWVRLSVADTGDGMSEEVASHALEPFYTTQPFGRAPGLGLSTCHGVVAQHGGRLSLESSPGRGTTVHIDLPRLDPPPRPATGLRRVLVIEADPAVRTLLTVLLRRLDCDVALHADLAEGLEHLRRSEPPDLAVVALPAWREAADAVCARLREAYPDLPAILLDATGERSDLAPERAVWMPKPFTSDEIQRHVTELLALEPRPRAQFSPSGSSTMVNQ